MASYSDYAKQAVLDLKAADTLLTKTYPVANDPKMLLSVLENVYRCFENMIKAALIHEKKAVFGEFSKDFEAFRKIANKYGATKERIDLVLAVKTAYAEHKSSPVEFARKKDYVICSDDYKHLKVLSQKELKIIVSKAKLFIADTYNLLGKKNERIVRRRA